MYSFQAWAVRGGSKSIAERFHDLVPDKALDFPFELDAFQKEVPINAKYTALYLDNESVISIVEQS